MIIKMFQPVKGFPGVRYNLNKIERGKAELLKKANFGALQGMSSLGVKDFERYFQSLAGLNKRTVYPQLHATISAEGRTSSKEQLLTVAEKWLELMGYGAQPYLIVFHKDTANNHVHIVTSRVDRNGKKINSAFEHNRAIAALNKAMGMDEDLAAKKDLKTALSYQFSTQAQFALILEGKGYKVRDNALIKFGRKLLVIPPIEFKSPSKQRATQLKAIFTKYRQQYDGKLVKDGSIYRSDLSDFLKQKFGMELIFHASGDKPPYGYTVIDHAQQNVYKGSEIMPLKELLVTENSKAIAFGSEVQTENDFVVPIDISIADDVDDQQIHGMRRRRQRKARTNTR